MAGNKLQFLDSMEFRVFYPAHIHHRGTTIGERATARQIDKRRRQAGYSQEVSLLFKRGQAFNKEPGIWMLRILEYLPNRG